MQELRKVLEELNTNSQTLNLKISGFIVLGQHLRLEQIRELSLI